MKQLPSIMDKRATPQTKSEVKLPPLLNTSSPSLDYLKEIRNLTKNSSDDTRLLQMTSSQNNTILNGSLLMSSLSQSARNKQYFLDQSIISSEIGKEVAQYMEYINQNEQKKMKGSEYETDFDLAGFLNSKSDKDKNQMNQHYVLQDDLKTYFYVEKKTVYAKINTAGKNFPMKVKVTGSEGVYDFYFSFFDPFPNKDNSSEEFPQRQNHLYKFNKPKTFSQMAYICLSSKESAKVELKVWFTDQKLEKFRSKDGQNIKPVQTRSMTTLKEKLKVDLSEQEMNILKSEVCKPTNTYFNSRTNMPIIKEDIRERNALKYKMTDQSMVNKNKELAGQVELLQRKKKFDFITHELHCQEVIRRNVSQQLIGYQEKQSKYFSKILTHRHNMDKIAKAKKQREIKSLSQSWIPFLYLNMVIAKLQEKIYVSNHINSQSERVRMIYNKCIKMTKLSDIFKGRVTRAFEDLARNFKGKKMETKPYLTDKQRLLSDILLQIMFKQIEFLTYRMMKRSMNVKAKQVKKVKKAMAVKVLIYFVKNQKQNAIMNQLVALSKKMLHHVVLIQKKRRQNVNLHQYISMRMLDGIIEKLKDQDFRLKQIDPEAREKVEISYYSNFLKKREKANIIKAFLKIVKEQFKRMLLLIRGKEEPATEEEKALLAIEAKNVNKELKNVLDIIQPIVKRDQVEEIIEVIEETEQKEKNSKKEQEKNTVQTEGDAPGPQTEESIAPADKEEDEEQQEVKVEPKKYTGKYNLSPTDFSLMEVIRMTQVKMRIIQNRPILHEMVLKKLNEIKKEKEEGLNELYLTQQAAK